VCHYETEEYANAMAELAGALWGDFEPSGQRLIAIEIVSALRSEGVCSLYAPFGVS